jgi:hypothetical protein
MIFGNVEFMLGAFAIIFIFFLAVVFNGIGEEER